MAKRAFQPDYSVAPGVTLKETLDTKGMSQADLCLRTGMAEKTVSQIINGIAPISYETAEKLELATGVPAHFWNQRELTYRETIVRREEAKRLESASSWLKQIPLRELIERGFVEDHEDKVERVRHALKFFRVSSVDSWNKTWKSPVVQYRGGIDAQVRHPGLVAAWLRMGEVQAEGIDCEPFDAKAFQMALDGVRKLTIELARTWQRSIEQLCAPAGVAVVFTREIPRAMVSGCTKWLTKDKALLQVSLKYKTDEQLWLTLFHEAGHILHHSKRQLFLEFGNSGDSKEENEANLFARNVLIPSQFTDQLPQLRTKAQIRAFAKRIGIAPGIVVERLQSERILLPSHFNDLKRKLAWST